MTTVSVLNAETKDSYIQELLDSGVLIRKSDAIWNIDISKCFRDDYSINLELLELAVEYAAERGCKYLYLVGVDDYLLVRQSLSTQYSLDKLQHEKKFIMMYVASLCNNYTIDGGISVGCELTNTV